MFEQFTYIGYNVLFCVPFLVLVWSRKEFYNILKDRIRPILLATFVLTLYGSLIWPLALELRCWEYGDGKITGIKLFNFVYLDDVVWWFLVNLLIVTYVSLSTHYEKKGVDICWRELKGVLGSFRFAFREFANHQSGAEFHCPPGCSHICPYRSRTLSGNHHGMALCAGFHLYGSGI